MGRKNPGAKKKIRPGTKEEQSLSFSDEHKQEEVSTRLVPLLFVSGGMDLVVPMPEEQPWVGSRPMTGLELLQEGGEWLLKAGQGLLDVFADQDESWPASF